MKKEVGQSEVICNEFNEVDSILIHFTLAVDI